MIEIVVSFRVYFQPGKQAANTTVGIEPTTFECQPNVLPTEVYIIT